MAWMLLAGIAVLAIVWHCRVNHGIVPRHVIAGGGLETGAASDMFVDGKEGGTRHIQQTATKHACRARCAYRCLGLQNYLDVFAIVFAIYTPSANPVIIDNAGIYLSPISHGRRARAPRGTQKRPFTHRATCRMDERYRRSPKGPLRGPCSIPLFIQCRHTTLFETSRGHRLH
jgi:hypothetical protein